MKYIRGTIIKYSNIAAFFILTSIYIYIKNIENSLIFKVLHILCVGQASYLGVHRQLSVEIYDNNNNNMPLGFPIRCSQNWNFLGRCLKF